MKLKTLACGATVWAIVVYIMAQVNAAGLVHMSQACLCSLWGCMCVWLFYDGTLIAADLKAAERCIEDLRKKLLEQEHLNALISKKLDDNYQLMLENRTRLMSLQKHVIISSQDCAGVQRSNSSKSLKSNSLPLSL